jgi:hypothetical protein
MLTFVRTTRNFGMLLSIRRLGQQTRAIFLIVRVRPVVGSGQQYILTQGRRLTLVANTLTSHWGKWKGHQRG